MHKLRLVSVLFLLLLSGAVNAALITIDFESDTLGDKGASFTSVDTNLVSFTAQDRLSISDFGIQSVGQGLAAFGDDAGIGMDFSVFVDSLSLVFGNDDPNFSETKAILTVFDGAIQMGQVELIYNKNDAADETIAISGVGNFNRATLVYEDGTSALAEVVDNIEFNTADARQIPIPASIWLMIMGLGFLLSRRK